MMSLLNGAKTIDESDATTMPALRASKFEFASIRVIRGSTVFTNGCGIDLCRRRSPRPLPEKPVPFFCSDVLISWPRCPLSCFGDATPVGKKEKRKFGKLKCRNQTRMARIDTNGPGQNPFADSQSAQVSKFEFVKIREIRVLWFPFARPP
jgi:hypothetical protein